MTCVYKIIIKVLLLRLGQVLDDTILLNQSVFVGGRKILNVSLVANKVVEYTGKTKRNWLQS